MVRNEKDVENDENQHNVYTDEKVRYNDLVSVFTGSLYGYLLDLTQTTIGLM